MARRDEKKHVKQIKRQRRQIVKRQYSEARRIKARRRDRYPSFIFAGEADPGFERLIREAASGINFEDKGLFVDGEREAYRLLRSQGAEAAMKFVYAEGESLNDRGDLGRHLVVYWALNLGSQIFRKAGVELEEFLPFNDVQFIPWGDRILGKFSKLETSQSENGRVFFSPVRPTIEIDGEVRIVGFSRHSLERICDRLNPRWRTYAGLGDVFGTLHNCVNYEYSLLLNGQPSFTFFNRCDDDLFSQYRYVTDVLGGERSAHSGGSCYYRVGYCPAVKDGEFLKAKTFLMPGFSRTPEFGLIRDVKLSQQERQRLHLAATNISNDSILFGSDMEVIRWFHDRGIPQVIQTSRQMFEQFSSPQRVKAKFSPALQPHRTALQSADIVRSDCSH